MAAKGSIDESLITSVMTTSMPYAILLISESRPGAVNRMSRFGLAK